MNGVMNVYGLFDKVRGKFLNVALEENDFIAKRNFLEQVSQSGHLMYIAKDLEFYRLGELDLVTGLMTPLGINEMICRGTDYEKV